MRRAWLPVLFLLAGCTPDRSNPFDPANAPIVQISVASAGLHVVEGRRQDPLRILVQIGGPTRPADVKLETFDPRSSGAGSSCPHFDDATVGTLSVSTASSIAWTSFPPACFEHVDTGAAVQDVGLRATATTSRGRAIATTTFRLRNAVPVADPGPDLWVDPAFGRIASLSGIRSGDPDAASDTGETLVWNWSQTGGPAAALSATDTRDLTADLGPNPGAEFRFELSLCDRWQDCSAPAPLVVHARAADWQRAADGVVLIDSEWSWVQDIEDAAGTVISNVPTTIAPARDGVWYLPGTSLYRVQPDFVANRITLPSPFFAQRLLGSEPKADTVWVTGWNGSSTVGLVQVGPGSATTVLPFAGATLNDPWVVAQFDSTAPLWTAGQVVDTSSGMAIATSYHLTWKDSLSSGEITLAQDDCLFGGVLVEALGTEPDGSAWAGSGVNLVHAFPDGTWECFSLAGTGSAVDPVTSIVWTPGADGQGELIVGYSGSSTFSGFGIVRMPSGAMPGATLRQGPLLNLDTRGVSYDPDENRVFLAGEDGISAWRPGHWDAPIATAALPSGLQQNDPPDPDTFRFAMDGAGRIWSTQSGGGRMVRAPGSLSIVRRHLYGADLAALPITEHELSVDPATGNLWVLRYTFLGSEVAPFDERGPVDPAVATPIPVPYNTDEILFDPGVPGGRAPGLWIRTSVDEVKRLALDGTLVASFGSGSAPVPFFPEAPRALALAPDGAAWLTSDNAFPDPECGVYRLDPAGTSMLATGSDVTLLSSPAYDASRGVVDGHGKYWTYRDGTLVRTTAQGVQSEFGSNLCSPGPDGTADYVMGLFEDRPAGQIVVECGDGTTQTRFHSLLRVDEVSGAVKSGPVLVTSLPSQLPSAGEAGMASTVDGTYVTYDQYTTLSEPIENTQLKFIDRNLKLGAGSNYGIMPTGTRLRGPALR